MVEPSTTAKGYTYDAHPGWWWATDIDDEPTPELQWPKSVAIYDTMRRADAQIGSVLNAVTLPIRRTGWRIDPNGADERVVQLVAEDLGLPVVGSDPVPTGRTKGRFSWQHHLYTALLMLPIGHSFFEQIYRIDAAGLARLRKLEWRPHRTIAKINVARDGGLVSIEQHPSQTSQGTAPGRGPVIPVERLVAYVNDREGGNWLGSSLLRPAYKNWLIKDRLLRTQAQTVERNGMGIPVYEVSQAPEALLDPVQIDERATKERDAGQKIVEALRAGDTAGASIPAGAKLNLTGVSGTLPDANGPIRYHDEQIARAVLAHFLNLGGDQSTGSYALGDTFAEFFTLALQTVAESVRDIAQQHVVEDLVDLNFGEQARSPRLVFDEIGSRHPATAAAMQMLLQSGAITPDDGLEQHLRTMYSLPEREPDTTRASSDAIALGALGAAIASALTNERSDA